MPKVTLVEPQKKTLRQSSGQGSKRFNIFLDGKFAFGVDEDLVVERRLVIGKEISPEDLEKILFGAEVGKLMERMYGLISIRQRSEKEIRDYLKQLSFKRKVKDQDELSEVIIESLISKLKQKGLINDEHFAKAWVEARSKKKGWRAIQAELFQKGIDRETQERVKGQVLSIEGEEAVVWALLERKSQKWKNLSEMKFRKKAYDLLMRRGFGFEVVKDVVEKLLKKE